MSARFARWRSALAWRLAGAKRSALRASPESSAGAAALGAQVAALTALKASVDARGVSRSRQVGAGASLASDLALGKEIIVMIDAALSHVLNSDQATLVSWRLAKRPTAKGAVARASVVSAPAVVTVVAGVASSVLGGRRCGARRRQGCDGRFRSCIGRRW